MAINILTTKLFIPQIPEKHIKREALIHKLLSRQNLKSQLTLVCAPAGYGKTTLILEYLAEVHSICGWISLDDSDNDAIRFLTYLIEAIKKAGIPIGNEVMHLISDSGFNSMNTVLTEIINCIAAVTEKIILVLDDYHLISNQRIDEMMKFLLENQPPNLHLIIITRQDPQFPLSKLRVNGRLTEIRMGELCFSNDESSEFFHQSMDIEINENSIEKITGHTEGWIAGMQLAGLMIRGLDEAQVENVINKFNGTHSYIIDYLVEEVLGQQPKEIRDFLCKTAILERMNGELCDEITGGCAGKSILQQLEKSNLFLIPLDSTRDWYRYHHLFADSLKMELSMEEEKSLYKKAAGWMKKNGFPHEAVRYAFKSGDMKLSLNLVEDCVFDMFQNAQLETLIQWIELLPAELVKTSEILVVRKSIALFITGNIKAAMEHLYSLGEDFEDYASSHNKGLLLSLKALIAAQSGKDAELLASDALEFLEPWDPIARTSTLNTLGKAQSIKGRMEEAVETFRGAYETGFKMGYTFVTTLALMNYGICLDTMGRQSEAFKLFTDYIEGMRSKYGKPLPFVGIIYIPFAEIYYERNEIEKAKAFISEGIELCKSISYNWLVSSITLSNITFLSGDKEAAIEILKNMLVIPPKADMSGQEIQTIGILTQQLLRMGKLQDAYQYIDIFEAHIDNQTTIEWEYACVPYSRLILQKGEFDKAIELLLTLEKKLIINCKQKNLITVLILLAQAYFKKGDQSKIVHYLRKAITLSTEEKYLSLFIEEEPFVCELISMPGILEEIQETEFVNVLLTYFNNQNMQTYVDQRNIKNKGKDTLEYGERLSEREAEILGLIGAGFSNHEISKTLFISTNTTQWHISHIYSKLGVKSRTQAILKAKETGLL